MVGGRKQPLLPAQGKRALRFPKGMAAERTLCCQHPPAPQPCLSPRTGSQSPGFYRGTGTARSRPLPAPGKAADSLAYLQTACKCHYEIIFFSLGLEVERAEGGISNLPWCVTFLYTTSKALAQQCLGRIVLWSSQKHI